MGNDDGLFANSQNIGGYMGNLAKKRCTACIVGVSALKEQESKTFYLQLDEGWELVNNHHLEKTFRFKNFKETLFFVNKIGQLAEEERHHPVMELSWGQLKVQIWTHQVNGLTESDFILADKIDAEFIAYKDV